MESIACTIEELNEIERTKTYTNFSKPILKALQEALRHKLISKEATLIWMFLKGEATFHPELAIKKSVRNIADDLGINKDTANKAIKQLEQGGYLVVERVKNNLKHIPSTLKVRFPKTGIELARTDANRRKSANNTLSTKTSEENGHRCPKKSDDIKNKQSTKNINNTYAQTCSQTSENKSPDNNTDVDRCLPSAVNEKTFPLDPVDETALEIDEQIKHLSEKLDELNQLPRDKKSSLEWINQNAHLSSKIKDLKQQKEAVPCKKEEKTTFKETLKKLITTRKPWSKRQEPLSMNHCQYQKLTLIMRDAAKKHKWSSPSDQLAWAKFHIENYTIDDDFEVALRKFKGFIMKTPNYRMPGGYIPG